MTSDAPVSAQIFSISKRLILGLLILSAFAIGTTVLIRSTFVEYRGTALITLTGGAILEDLLEARLAVVQWELSQDDAYAEEFRGNIEELVAAEADVMADMDQPAYVTEAFENLKADLAEYDAQFYTMLAARADYDALQEEVMEAGLTAQASLTEIMTMAHEDGDTTAVFYAGRVQQAAMSGRYYLGRYQRTENPADLEQSVAEMRRASSEVKTLRIGVDDPLMIELVDGTFGNIMRFVNRADALSEAVQIQVNARGVMDTLGQGIASDVETVIDLAADRQNMLGPRGYAISFWAVVAICGAALLIVALGWRVSKKLSTRISGDIEDAVATMSHIAEGDLDIAVQNSDLDNEIGRMAKALEVFKANGKASIEASEREKAAEAERRRAAEAQKQRQAEQEAAAQEQAEAARKKMIADLSSSLGNVVSAASDGDFSRRVDADFNDDELAALAGNVNTLVESVEHGLSATGETLSRVAGGDFTQQMQGEFKGAFKDLQSSTNHMIDALSTLIGDIGGSVVNLSSSSDELRDTSDALSKQAEQNAASLEETSAALEELTASIKQVSGNMETANRSAGVARETAETSSVVAADAAEAINRISQASQDIAKVVTVINDISFQINLLALNAGVEAARAGEAGRGFSVVASEVRQLAQRAGEAAKEIDDVIASSDRAVVEGVEKVNNARTSLDKISQSVVGVSEGIDQITSAIAEQVNGIAEINSAVAQIDSNTQKQAASFEEVTATSALLSNEADGLKQSTAMFKTASNVVSLAKERNAGTQKAETAPGPSGSPAAAAAHNLAIDHDSWDDF
ncbi:methyl-accepting chemotaxis protein [uncultured Roseobacter sp.]|uniref:methyl-accepting chemotaxis protein n=1 Tax=uncultured Roseobacter sp. TaxID=114847 RepID=UPI00262FE705|nr:methyl-accepting chemotaxis protein [uncultured Roseobacter sp.]